jgi:hypothetical protein
MLLVFPCPKCEQTVRREISEASGNVECSECDWTRTIPKGEIQQGRPQACLVCGCGDLWRQKDFPPQLGLTMVGLGALCSTIAWAMYWPVAAIAILLGFAGIDLLLYWLMPDVLVCYRCESRHRRAELDDEHTRFDLEVAERYRQEAIRLEEVGKSIT